MEPGEAPELDSMDWLWYKPLNPPGGSYADSLYHAHHAYCSRCDTYGVHDAESERRQCWKCGKFIPGPGSTPPPGTNNYNRYNIFRGLG